MRRIALLLLIAAGCRSTAPTTAASAPAAPPPPVVDDRGSVAAKLLSDPGGPSLRLGPGEEYVQPQFTPGNRLPEYPADLIPLHLPPQVIVVRMVVDESRHITAVTQSPLRESTESPHRGRLEEAVRRALQEWSVWPPAIRKVRPGPDSNGDGQADYQILVDQLVLKAYFDLAFTFEVVDGRGVVKSAAEGAGKGMTIDKAALARTAEGEARTTVERVRSVVAWTNQAFEWTYTDYARRTVDEVITRGGGNCNEQAMVVLALLGELGVRTRRVREINVQPPNPGRQERAVRRVIEAGPGASVFGLAHNDHVWLEFFDDETKEWTPADPTLNLVGFPEWLAARVGFGERPTHPIVASRDMLVPFVIVANSGAAAVPRTERYLVAGFDTLYDHRLSSLPSWRGWTSAIAGVQQEALAALEGTTNLHEHAARIEAVKAAYDRLATEYRATLNR